MVPHGKNNQGALTKFISEDLNEKIWISKCIIKSVGFVNIGFDSLRRIYFLIYAAMMMGCERT